MRHFERMAPFRSHSVISLVPEGFQRYVRIFHPASRNDSNHCTTLRWADMAHYTGAKPHALMQWNNISAPRMNGSSISPPNEGTIPPAVSQPLRDLLFRHSQSNNCWLGVWPGFGGNYRKYVPDTAIIDTKYREWKIFRASLSDIDLAFFEGWDQTANLVWCEYFDWWITTDIDLNTTYMGCDEQLFHAILGSQVLEAWSVAPDDDISKFSDTINPIDDRDVDSTPQIPDHIKEKHQLLSRKDWQLNRPLTTSSKHSSEEVVSYYSASRKPIKQKWLLDVVKNITDMKKASGSRYPKWVGWIISVAIGMGVSLYFISIWA